MSLLGNIVGGRGAHLFDSQPVSDVNVQAMANGPASCPKTSGEKRFKSDPFTSKETVTREEQKGGFLADCAIVFPQVALLLKAVKLV